MRKSLEKQQNTLRLWLYNLILALGWTLVVGLSLWWNLKNEGQEKLQLAYNIARSHLEKDMMLREWNINHGLVYAPVSDGHRPAPHAGLPPQEVRTPSGKVLIPVTSSSMIRQVYELSARRIQIQGHLTGLLPLRAENAPDVWEIKALQDLKRGKQEFSELASWDNRPYFRMMWPLPAKPPCLACHGHQGFQAGDLLGGITVSVPMDSIWAASQSHFRTLWGAHLVFWLLGLAGIGVGGRQLGQKLRSQIRVEKALRESQERFTHIIESTLEVIWEVNREGRFTYLSPTVEEVLGYAPEEMLGRPFFDFFYSEDREALLRGGWLSDENHLKFKNFRNRHVRKDGEVIWLLTSGVPFFDDQGRFLGYRGANIDITARKQAEDDLMEQQGLLKAINQIFHEALDCRTEEDLAGVCLATAARLTGSSIGWIGEIDKDNRPASLAQLAPHEEKSPEPSVSTCRSLTATTVERVRTRLAQDKAPFFDNDPGQPWASLLGAPLMHQGRLIGLIVLGDKGSGYQEMDLEMVEQLAPSIVEALERKRAERQLKEKEELRKTIMEAVGVGVVLIDQRSLTIVEANPFAARLIGLPREEVIGQPCQRFFHSEAPGSCPLKESIQQERTERVLWTAQETGMPILKTVVRVMKDGSPYLLESFVDLTEQRQTEEALSRANERLQGIVREIGQNNQDVNLLRELGELLQVCQSLTEALPLLEQYAGRLFREEAGGLYLLNNSENLLEAVSIWGAAETGRNFFSPDDCWALRRGRSHQVTEEDLGASRLICRHVHADDPGPYLCMPLSAQGETLGLIHLQRRPEFETVSAAPGQAAGVGFSEARIKFIETAAEHISLALSNLKLREKLRYQAIRDPLTGLFNRRYLQETLEREIQRAHRGERPLGVLMLDLDHFKRFNDTYGHDIGDALLRAFSGVLKKMTRGEDIACRYGGEEFTLIIPECPLSVLTTRAEEIRRAVEAIALEHGGRTLKAVTVSIGIAAFPDHGLTGEVLLQAADAALYQAKKTGRNRVLVAGHQREQKKTDVPQAIQAA